DMWSSVGKIFALLMSSIATISLLVGGVGIMNIMLVSVTERTREIGLRKALGARRRDILAQFLIEALVISFFGGGIGIALGSGLSSMLARLTEWTMIISAQSILIAFGFSAIIGVLFGLWPARKAALLNPIDALRYE
ncbi:MAG TPA: FtsX-like permease family protein, partial [Pontiella sp.]|nr:FtsX-like permease family protein [Pontiella sp.]